MTLRLIALLVVIVSFSVSVDAAVTDGPQLDLKNTIDPPPPPENLLIGFTIHFPQDTYNYDPNINRIVKDRSKFWIEYHFDLVAFPPPRHVIGLMYKTWSDASRTGHAEITTIYGADPDPASPTSMSILGFAPGDLIGVEEETMIGASGTEYAAHTSLTSTVGDLSTLLPGFDLSPFGGDPNDIVYVFQTTMPLSDMTTPEPATLSLLALGGLAMLRRRK